MLDSSRHPLLAGLALGLVHALLFGLAFPPADLWVAAVFSVAPLIIAAVRADRPARTSLGVALASMPMWAFHHQYVWAMSEAGIFPLLIYLAAYPAIFVWLLARLHARRPGVPVALAAPILWTALEILRGEIVWDGYAQYLLGQAFISRMVAGAAPYLGVYAVSFIVVLLATNLAPERLFREGAPRSKTLAEAPLATSAGLVLHLALLCTLVLPRAMSTERPSGSAFTVAAVQTNVQQDNRLSRTIDERLADFRLFCDLTRQAADSDPRPDLIVWPETMFPGYALNPSALAAERAAGLAYAGNIPTTVFHDTLVELQKEIGIPLLIGAQAAEGLKIAPADGRIEIDHDAIYNSAFLIRNGMVEDLRYDKMQLMPFGEVMPYISKWEWLERRLLAIGGRGLTFDLEPGNAAVAFEVERRQAMESPEPGRTPETVRIAAPICFETTYERQMRRLAGPRNEPIDLFINLSNDGWFAWYDAGRRHVVRQCQWRSLELGIPMLRAVNTGISAAIDARGRVSASLPPRSAGVLSTTFNLDPASRTIIHWPASVVRWGCLLAMVALAAGAMVPRRSIKEGKAQP